MKVLFWFLLFLAVSGAGACAHKVYAASVPKNALGCRLRWKGETYLITTDIDTCVKLLTFEAVVSEDYKDCQTRSCSW